MKIRISDSIGKKYVEINTEKVSVDEVLEEIYSLLVAYGFHPESIKNAILDKAAILENEE